MSKSERAARQAGNDVDPITAALAAVDAARRKREQADAAEQAAIDAARSAGAAWSRIGALYGLTKQGAQQRFKRPAPDAPAVADGAQDGVESDEKRPRPTVRSSSKEER